MGLGVREQAIQHTFGQADGIHMHHERKLSREVCLELVRFFAEATHNLGRRNKSLFSFLFFGRRRGEEQLESRGRRERTAYYSHLRHLHLVLPMGARARSRARWKLRSLTPPPNMRTPFAFPAHCMGICVRMMAHLFKCAERLNRR